MAIRNGTINKPKGGRAAKGHVDQRKPRSSPKISISFDRDTFDRLSIMAAEKTWPLAALVRHLVYCQIAPADRAAGDRDE